MFVFWGAGMPDQRRPDRRQKCAVRDCDARATPAPGSDFFLCAACEAELNAFLRAARCELWQRYTEN